MQKKSKNSNESEILENKKGITLIALIITIIVLLILAGITISALAGENGILNNASLAKISTEFANYKEEVEMYKMNKLLEDYDFEGDTLTAGQTLIEYDGKSEGETGNIKTVIEDLDDKYLDKFIIINGNLYLMATEGINDTEIKAAEVAGIEVMPYEISEEGELLSSNANLALQGTNGTLVVPEIVKSIGSGAFSGVDGLKKIILPPSVTEIGNNAFSYNLTLEEVEIQGNLTRIGDYAFDQVTNLKKINLPDSISYIGLYAFRRTALTEVTIPKNVKTLRGNTFMNCTNLERVIFQEGITTISRDDFRNTPIAELKLPSTLTSISGSAFNGCSQLERIDISDNDNFVYESGMLMTKKKDQIIFISRKVVSSNSTLEIPEGIKTFDANISNFYNITKLVLPSTLNTVSALNLPVNVVDIEVKSGNTNLISENGILYTTDNKLVVCYSKDKDITLKEGITELQDYSFYLAMNAEIINLPESLQKIGTRVFENNKNLKEVHIGKNVSSIDPILNFINFSGTYTMDEENKYYTIENNVLYSKDENGNKSTLVRVLSEINGTMQIDKEINSIGNRAFYGQSKLTEITIPDNVTSIGSAFRYCENLKRVEIPESVTSIDEGCFADATNNLDEIIIHNTEGSIPGAPWGAVKGMRVVQWVGK